LGKFGRVKVSLRENQPNWKGWGHQEASKGLEGIWGRLVIFRRKPYFQAWLGLLVPKGFKVLLVHKGICVKAFNPLIGEKTRV